MATKDKDLELQKETQSSAGTVFRSYQPSEAVKSAQAKLQSQLTTKPGAYQSPWQTQLDDTMKKILNREKFNYDLNGDALWQQYKDRYVQQGKMAMMDTMGQASALTGGYGNSYAQQVGQQTYQQYLTGLTDKIPELYQLALDKYRTEGDDLYTQYGILGDRENLDYGRYRDGVADWNTEYNRLYGEYADERGFDYGQHADQMAQEQWQAEFDENKRRYDQEWAEAHPELVGGSAGEGNGPNGPYGDPNDKTALIKRKHGADRNFGELDIEAVMAQATNKVEAVALAEMLAKRGADEQALVYILDRDWTKKGNGSLYPTSFKDSAFESYNKN